jgi:hypothetical protein
MRSGKQIEEAQQRCRVMQHGSSQDLIFEKTQPGGQYRKVPSAPIIYTQKVFFAVFATHHISHVLGIKWLFF